MPTTILARQDSLGDLLLAGPAIRAVAARSRVVLLCSPAGAAAARILPGVAEVIIDDSPWIVADPDPVDPESFDTLVRRLRRVHADVGVVLTSPRQSALPTALALRLAGVRSTGAYSRDYPGALLDVRLREDPPVHEVERNLALVAAMGFAAPDDVRMRVQPEPLPGSLAARLPERFVVVHPGATASSRTLDADRWVDACHALRRRGLPVVVTGLADLVTSRVVREVDDVVDLRDATSFGRLAAVLAAADVVCVGNTGVMHLAAAVGTPVVACFPATVPTEQWRPWMVDHVVLQAGPVDCSPCYRRDCDRPGHPCAAVDGDRVAAAAMSLMPVGVR